LSAAHVAVRVQVPEPLVIVAEVPVLEQEPPEVMTAVVLAFVDEATVKPAPNAALAGAPVNVTVGAILPAVVDWPRVVPL
jgi:hypothetical protein